MAKKADKFYATTVELIASERSKAGEIFATSTPLAFVLVESAVRDADVCKLCVNSLVIPLEGERKTRAVSYIHGLTEILSEMGEEFAIANGSVKGSA